MKIRMKDKVLFGDCRDTLAQIARSDSKARMCITSPPYYGLRDYGKEDSQIGLEQSPEEFIDELVKVFRGVRDCLTDDGTLWVNIGDSYYNYRGGKGQALPKQSVAKTNQDLPQGINPRRGNKLKGYKEKDLIGIPWMLAFALRKDGWYLRQDIIWSKPNPMPESVRDRCTKSHEYIFLLSKSQNYYFDVNSIKEPTVDKKGMKRKKSVWEVKTKPYKGAHFAVYPTELIVSPILAGSEEGDIILDPFMGSGTTAAVAKSLDRHYLGCELHEEYDELIQKRVNEVTDNKTSRSPLDQLM
jgi:DNA modification methylase|tara:strand:+ start:1303 stop:2199 length:897 start_codon:yes stop_codon:yes gene_type:complete